MQEEIYKIKTTNFEGPFGLLLSLVEQRKLFINEISLAQVTEDYLKYVETLGSLSPHEISSFIIVAATLILIKSNASTSRNIFIFIPYFVLYFSIILFSNF